MGAQLVKEVAMKTNGVAGDGTTTATVLAQAMVREGLRRVDAGANPMQVRRGIEQAVDGSWWDAADGPARSAAATTCCTSRRWRPATTEVIGDGDRGRGRPGRAATASSQSRSRPRSGSRSTFVDGIEFDHGYMSPYMVTDRDRMEAVLENPYVLLTNKKISQVQELMPVLEQASEPSGRCVDPRRGGRRRRRCSMLVANMSTTRSARSSVRAPGFGHRRIAELEDLAAAMGGG